MSPISVVHQRRGCSRKLTGRKRPIAANPKSWHVLLMLMKLAVLLATASVSAEVATPQQGIRDAICKMHLPAVAGDKFSLLALPAHKRNNESGVLLLVNCSRRKILSIRDASKSQRKLTELVYDSRVSKKVGKDGRDYEFINFNERSKHSFMEANVYSKNTFWRGPCRFDRLELTTVEPGADEDRKTVTFSLNVCENMVLALIEPAP